jgi:uncharacterized Ntn-hydrolase superfamily protein
VAALVAADEGRDQRQVHAIDAQWRIGSHTGARCSGRCGLVAGDDVSVAGNILAGASVIEESAAAYSRESRLSLPRRLVAAMCAGEAAGGDRRGKQSAALVIYGEEAWPDLDLRVDDHPDPLAEVTRLERVSHDVFVPIRRFLPRRRDRVGQIDRAVIENEIAKAAAAKTPP